jgi:hypothetical protein
METNLTHWKKLTNPDYLGAYSIPPDKKYLVVTITEVKQETIVSNNGKKDLCTVAYLKNEKPMILNRTNCKTISSIYKTPHIENWKGKSIKLFVDTTSLKGEQVECLRIVNEVPPLPELTPESPKWLSAKEAILAGKVTMEKIEEQYYLSKENRKLIQAK